MDRAWLDVLENAARGGVFDSLNISSWQCWLAGSHVLLTVVDLEFGGA